MLHERYVLGGEAEVYEHEGDVGHKLVGREEENVKVPGVEHVAVQLCDAVPQLHLRLCIRRQPVLLQFLCLTARVCQSVEVSGMLQLTSGFANSQQGNIPVKVCVTKDVHWPGPTGSATSF